MGKGMALLGACAALAAAAPAWAQESGAGLKIHAPAPSATQLALLPLGDTASLKFGGDLRFDLAPTAAPAAGPGSVGPSFGGTLRVGGRDKGQAVRDGLGRLGVSAKAGESLQGQGRLYLFAAASGTAVGMNLVRGDEGWRSSGLTTDAAASFVMSGQAGVGWRRDSLQASVGYVRRKFKISDPHQQVYPDLYHSSDDAVALSLSFKPSR